ncbi:uncharacterized protein TM35_000471550 [Trypanosoma theileri]|uniref:Surface protease GP63 n=1 Tax=Trypanosoma theileri TaxID=67003 RepID=A0A1X0NJH6_9TRYP|nr:uncharacterized protein TM35_000471550 [Trypanosoma theileri]ORC84260.1 hypothetical protein TM35_000471550 [Trypanosoma theileri]
MMLLRRLLYLTALFLSVACVCVAAGDEERPPSGVGGSCDPGKNGSKCVKDPKSPADSRTECADHPGNEECTSSDGEGEGGCRKGSKPCSPKETAPTSPKEPAPTTPQELASTTPKEPETGGADNTNAENANIPNNGEESNSTTTTTTTTTTLPPELINNRKGDADSSSISSVWVRVPLLIVVTLACILVC